MSLVVINYVNIRYKVKQTNKIKDELTFQEEMVIVTVVSRVLHHGWSVLFDSLVWYKPEWLASYVFLYNFRVW